MANKYTFVYPPHPGHVAAHQVQRSREYETEQEAWSAAIAYARTNTWAKNQIRIERNGCIRVGVV
jgi:hypothetical protein